MEQPNYWERLARKRLSRRKLLAAGGVATLGGGAALVVGCGGSDNKNGSSGGASGSSRPSGAAGGSPRPGGEVVFGRLLNVGGIDPHIDLTGLDIDTQLYSYLYNWDPINEVLLTNNFATAFEQPDPEHLDFIFSFRKGVLSGPNGGPAQGEELTSDDVRATFIRRGTSLTAPDKRFPYRIGGTNDVNKLVLALDQAIQTPDPYSLSFKMQQPFVPSIREMANPTWGIVPRKVIDKFGLRLSQQAYGSGPFMLEQFRGSERIKLVKNPNYFLSPRPWVDRITYIVITEAASLLAAFESGDHDVNGAVLTKKKFEEYQNDSRFTVARAPSLFYPCVEFKMKPPYSDIRVREAIDMAINRDDFIDAIWDGEANYNGPIQWPQFKWSLPQDELRSFYTFNLDKARANMEQAGYGDGFNARMKIPKVSGATFIAQAAALIKEHLSKIKISIEIEEVEVGTFIASVILPGNFEMTFFPNLPYDEPDRPLSFYHTRGVTGNGNWTNYTNPALDKLIDAQSEEFDEEKRKQIIYEAQRMMIKEHGPQITLPGGYAYSARWSYVHFPFEIGQPTPKDIGPYNVDLWTEEGT